MEEYVFNLVSSIFIGLLWFECITSNYESYLEQCFEVGQQRICYLIRSNHHYSWNESHEICNSANFSLPIFQNMDEQITLGSYLGHLKLNGMTISAVWTPGKIKLLDDWTWVNRKKWNSFPPIKPPLNGTHVILTGRHLLLTEDPTFQSWFLCQYSNELCKSRDYIPLKTTCTEWRLDFKSWYDARNYCLHKGGDLLDLAEEEDTPKLIAYVRSLRQDLSSFKFWIGLRKITWIWHLEFPEEVTFTNWFNDSQILQLEEELCIYVDASYNQWKTSSCNVTMSVVCQRREDISTINYGVSTEIMQTSESESINYIALWSAIGVSVLLLTCIGAIVITVVIVKRQISHARRDTAVDKPYEGMNKLPSVDNYDTIDHYDAIDDLVDDNYESICDANYLELVATDTNENVEDRHSDNDANIAEERVCMPIAEFTNM